MKQRRSCPQELLLGGEGGVDTVLAGQGWCSLLPFQKRSEDVSKHVETWCPCSVRLQEVGL